MNPPSSIRLPLPVSTTRMVCVELVLRPLSEEICAATAPTFDDTEWNELVPDCIDAICPITAPTFDVTVCAVTFDPGMLLIFPVTSSALVWTWTCTGGGEGIAGIGGTWNCSGTGTVGGVGICGAAGSGP
ncbi:hypothetical protein LZP97_26900 (plasmid) [Rhodococcus sp. DMF-1]|uniref:hypothetical protein n=1 Tax=Rhodococcus sp. DMF-1 TaxID=2907624 RepID=UPI001F1B3D4B|nr:hypothetical protein [Rhodococcus sp. DMF-1]UIR39815.1 hypothetical protein LZP97_26900 [Rhodococcus sp. DMF-1]